MPRLGVLWLLPLLAFAAGCGSPPTPRGVDPGLARALQHVLDQRREAA